MQSTPFHSELRLWIQAVIRQRKMLIALNRSRANTMKMNVIMEQLELQLKAYPLKNDLQMASFFKRNIDKIHVLLPGEGSSCHLKREQQFYEYLNQSLTLLTNENLYQRGNNSPKLSSGISQVQSY